MQPRPLITASVRADGAGRQRLDRSSRDYGPGHALDSQIGKLSGFWPRLALVLQDRSDLQELWPAWGCARVTAQPCRSRSRSRHSRRRPAIAKVPCAGAGPGGGGRLRVLAEAIAENDVSAGQVVPPGRFELPTHGLGIRWLRASDLQRLVRRLLLRHYFAITRSL